MPDKKRRTGQIQIADEVIATIAGTAMHEVDGVVSIGGGFSLSKKNLARGVKISFDDNDNIIINIQIQIEHGKVLKTVAEEVQEKVKTAVETMTGIDVEEVNVDIISLHSEKQKEGNENYID